MTLLVCVSHGHTARGMLQTRLLATLSANGIRVLVTCRSDAAATIRGAVERQGAQIAVYDAPDSRVRAALDWARAYMHQDIRQNPALWEKHLRRVERGPGSWQSWLSRLLLPVGKVVRRHALLQAGLRKIEAALLTDRRADALLKRVKPTAVFSTRPVDPLEVCILSAATRQGVCKVVFPLSWDNISSKGIFPVSGDVYAAWGPIMREELREYYAAPAEAVHVVGVPHFDVHAAVRDAGDTPAALLAAMGLAPGQPYLLFTMSSAYYAPDELEVVEWLARRVTDGAFGAEMQLVIRPHMGNLHDRDTRGAWLTRLESLRSSRVGVNRPETEVSQLQWYAAEEDLRDLARLVNGAAVCINSGSTVALEALFCNKPVVLAMFDMRAHAESRSVLRLRRYIHLKTLLAFNACGLADSTEQLEALIKGYVEDPSRHATERAAAVAAFCHANDGKATDRIAGAILSIMDGVRAA